MEKMIWLFLLWLFVAPVTGMAIDAPKQFQIITNTPDWHFTVPRQPSRTAGVAPLSVHFSAGLTASTPETQPFHNYEYTWNFGDSNSGVWGTSGMSKNTDKGPVANHVYETPGTYIATLIVKDGSGTVDSETFTITVQDPNVVFSGNKTTCISKTSVFTGCPQGANQVVASNLSNINSYVDAGERVLLRRGDSWTLNSAISFPSNLGPVHIGAFGACNSPDAQGICANAPSITLTGSDPFIDLSRKRDWRIADISFSGAKTVPGAIYGFRDFRDDLLLRLKITGLINGIMWSNWRQSDSDLIDDNAIVSCLVSGSSDMVVYVGSERLSVMGNKIYDSDDTHVLRVFYGYQSVISHNVLYGASVASLNGRHALKLHGPDLPDVGTFTQTGSNGMRHFTQFAIISNNVFGSSGPWPVSVGPEDDIHDERLSDIIIEKNKCLADYGSSVKAVTVGLMFEGRYITVRNNIIDGTGGDTGGYTGIEVWRRGIEWTPLGNNVYNNTIYSQGSHSNDVKWIDVHPDADSTIIRNNLVSFPSVSNIVYSNQAGAETTSSNNLITNTPSFVDPNNANPLLRNFRLTSSSTALIGKGYTVPVFDDFVGGSRSTPYTVGAFTY